MQGPTCRRRGPGGGPDSDSTRSPSESISAIPSPAGGISSDPSDPVEAARHAGHGILSPSPAAGVDSEFAPGRVDSRAEAPTRSPPAALAHRAAPASRTRIPRLLVSDDEDASHGAGDAAGRIIISVRPP